MIQIINYSGKPNDELVGSYKDIKFNKINSPQSLDEFQINIIDLSNKYIWYNNGNNFDTINNINDFMSIQTMLNNSTKSYNVIMYPQNCDYNYYKLVNNSYHFQKQLKDMIIYLKNHMLVKLYRKLELPEFHYEITSTTIGDKKINASFYFARNENALTSSVGSCKTTTVRIDDKVIATTLKLDTYEGIINFLRQVNYISKEVEVPEWMNAYIMFDDREQLDIITENNEVICTSTENIKEASKILKQNNEIKSILYTNGDELVRVVFLILEEMLKCDLSEFKDEKKEDFAVKIDGKYLIGEIKGVTSNVKSQHVSQLDVHYQSFLEDDDLTQRDVKSVLIINHQRNKSLENREPIHEKQIELAKRNGSLIIETITLLRIFEQYKKDKVQVNECVDLLFKDIGLLKYELS